jgi:5-methylcytosine-specific restriction endonuclease McrA
LAPWPYCLPEYQRARTLVLEGGPTCALCGRRRADTTDHWPVTVLMVKRGLAPEEVLWDPANLRPACRSCNSRLGARAGNRWRGRRRWDTQGLSRRW